MLKGTILWFGQWTDLVVVATEYSDLSARFNDRAELAGSVHTLTNLSSRYNVLGEFEATQHILSDLKGKQQVTTALTARYD